MFTVVLSAGDFTTDWRRPDEIGPHTTWVQDYFHGGDEKTGEDVYVMASKHKTSEHYLYNVGPTSKTLGRRCVNGIQMFCV